MIGFAYIRNQSRIPLSKIANELCVSRQFISKWEKGEKKIPQKYLPLLSEIFNVDKDYFQRELSDTEKLEIKNNTYYYNRKVSKLKFNEHLYKMIELYEDECGKKLTIDGVDSLIEYLKEELYATVKASMDI